MYTIDRGTNPENTFTLPFELVAPQQIWLSYAQDDIVLIDKDKSSIVISGAELKVQLTQEDTLKLDHRKPVQVQVRILTADGAAIRSGIKEYSVSKILKDGIIS